MKNVVALLGIVIISFSIAGCDEPSMPRTRNLEVLRISMTQYATNHFFLDTPYRSQYEQYVQSIFHQGNPSLIVTAAEIYVSQAGYPVDYLKQHRAIAYINLSPMLSNRYDTTLRSFDSIRVGEAEAGMFRKLDPWEYTLDPVTGVLTVNQNLAQDGDIIAAAYTTSSGCTYGEFLADPGPDAQPAVLKLVKPMVVSPLYKTAWNLMLKNVYNLGRGFLQNPLNSHYRFAIDFVYYSADGNKCESIEGIPLLRLFGLDRLDRDGNPTPDGELDWLPGITVDDERGGIILPSLRPLDDGIRQWFLQNGRAAPDTFLFPELYDSTTVIAAQSNRNRFVISVRELF